MKLASTQNSSGCLDSLQLLGGSKFAPAWYNAMIVRVERRTLPACHEKGFRQSNIEIPKASVITEQVQYLHLIRLARDIAVFLTQHTDSHTV